jgi:DNA-binding NarL/FixJ family response regulator
MRDDGSCNPGIGTFRSSRSFQPESEMRFRADMAGAGAFAHYETARGLKSKLGIVRAHIAALTPRERQVFELIVRGNTNKQVARALGCTERTIKAHRHRVMERMQVQSLAELVSLAERVGVLAPNETGRPSRTA